ncbi:MAG TPA: molybdopterin-dependent oxidoreductase [Herpetosiphonaceae bacterium]
MKIGIVFFILWLSVFLTACQPGSIDITYRVVSQPIIKPGNPVPKPVGTPVLTVKGMISNMNDADRLDFDMQTLEGVGLVEYEVDDPFLKRVVVYRGPLLRDALNVAGVSPSAKELFAIALNDYKTTIPLEVNQWPVIIATSRDGSPMPLEDNGPLEIVFPNKHFSIDPAVYNQMWVWQLRELVVR